MIELVVEKSLKGVTGNYQLDVDLHLAAGEVVALFGASGAGKSTLLRMLAGLISPSRGYIKVDNVLWFDSAKQICLPPQKRQVGMVFQDYSLFPHLNVRDNLRFALVDKKDLKAVDAMLVLTGLENLQDRFPASLSGGQRQRVALARAMLRRPRVLLLDEPLSALDHAMRTQLQDEILALHRRFETTIILVSHDLAEVFKMAQRVCYLENGKIREDGSPLKVFSPQHLLGRWQVHAEVLAIVPLDMLWSVALLIGNQITRIVASTDEVQGLNPGDKVLLFQQAFHPMLIKIP
ncbi:MAG: ATP-binding cassette domain-containing protein [Acidithiobacillus sp.]